MYQWLSPGGYLRMSGNIFDCHNYREVLLPSSATHTNGCIKHTKMQRTALHSIIIIQLKISILPSWETILKEVTDNAVSKCSKICQTSSK